MILFTLQVADLLKVPLVLLVLVQGSFRSISLATSANEATIDFVGCATDTLFWPLIRVANLARFLLQVRAFVAVLPARHARGTVAAILAIDIPAIIINLGRAACRRIGLWPTRSLYLASTCTAQMESFDLRSKVWALVDTVRLQLSAVQALHGRIGFSLEEVFVSSDSACRTRSSSIFDGMRFSLKMRLKRSEAWTRKFN